MEVKSLPQYISCVALDYVSLSLRGQALWKWIALDLCPLVVFLMMTTRAPSLISHLATEYRTLTATTGRGGFIRPTSKGFLTLNVK